MDKLILGNKNYSSWSMRPWLALKKANIEFEEVVIALYQDDSKTNLKAFSPSGKVPVLVTEKSTLWDSLSICEYAAEIKPTLWPIEQHTRAWARSISHEMHSGFSCVRESMPMNCRAVNRKISITDAIESEIMRIEALWTQCLDEKNSALPWLFGEFSIADAMYAPIVSRFHTYGIQLNDQCDQYIQMVLNDKHVMHWYEAGAKESQVIEASEVGKI